MPTLTTNYALKKPIKATENADIDVINGNMDILDDVIIAISEKAEYSKDVVNVLKGAGSAKEKADLEYVNTEVGKKSNKIITDDTTSKKYEMGINNGMIYYREVVI